MVPGFPSYCTGSLSETPPSITQTGLTLRYCARLPTCRAESGSLALCVSDFLWLPSDLAVGQQRPCDSDYLPLSRGDSGFFQPDVFASFAGQTQKSRTRRLLVRNKTYITFLKILIISSVEAFLGLVREQASFRALIAMNSIFSSLTPRSASFCAVPTFAESASIA